MPKTENEEEMLRTGFRDTEKEIWSAATGTQEPDEKADRSLETMSEDDPEGREPVEDDEDAEGEAEGEEEGEGAEEETEPKGEGTPPPPEKPRDEQGRFQADEAGDKAKRGDPSIALRDERNKRQQLEAEIERLRARDREYEGLRRDVEALRASQSLPRGPQRDPNEPDQFAEPDRFWAYKMQQLRDERRAERIGETFADMRESDPQTFDAAYTAFQQLNPRNPVDYAQGSAIANAPNPGKALMRWHRERELIREVGGDPQAYKQKLRDELRKDPELRKEILAGLHEEASQGGTGRRPNTVTRLPSLNSASGRNSSRNSGEPQTDGSDAAIFDYATR